MDGEQLTGDQGARRREYWRQWKAKKRKEASGPGPVKVTLSIPREVWEKLEAARPFANVTMKRYLVQKLQEVAGSASVARRVQGKLGRNDPCPCGSGRKFKNCCGRMVGR